MENSNHRGDGRAWAINGRYLTQRMTGVQRYAHEIVAALDERLADDRAARLALRLVVTPAADAVPSLARIGICRPVSDRGTPGTNLFCRSMRGAVS
jgi:hypothetical protein